MKLNPNCNFTRFMSAVSECRGDVFFETSEGDVLNLKSELCRYVFAVVLTKPQLLENSTLKCTDPKDKELILPFLL